MFLYIYPDVFFTQGATQTLVVDIRGKNMWLIRNLPDGLLELFQSYPINEIQSYISDSSFNLDDFVSFVRDKNLGTLLPEVSRFRPIEEVYNSACLVEIGIVDFGIGSNHRIETISRELSRANCQHLQLRIFVPVNLEQITQYLLPFLNHSWFSIEILVTNPMWNSIDELEDFTRAYPMLSFIVFNQSERNYKKVSSIYGEQSISFILYTNQRFTSPEDCGEINLNTIYPPSTIQSFFLNKLHNNCLYKKIFVTQSGEIANCPCLPFRYGNIDKEDVDLVMIIKSTKFQYPWTIVKDKISTCKSCELRYLCNDCRAFLSELTEKPRKCSYNPYTGTWNE